MSALTRGAALIDKIGSGEMGELSYIRANRLTGRRWMPDQRERSNVFMEQLQFGKRNCCGWDRGKWLTT